MNLVFNDQYIITDGNTFIQRLVGLPVAPAGSYLVFNENILQNIYSDIKGSDNLEAFQLRALQNIQKVMDDVCGKYIEPFNDMYTFMMGKLVSSYDFSTIYLVFENLSNLMIII